MLLKLGDWSGRARTVACYKAGTVACYKARTVACYKVESIIVSKCECTHRRALQQFDSFIVHGPGIDSPPPPPLPGRIFGDNDFWIAQYVSFQYLLVCKMNYSAFRDYLRWYIAA